MSDDNTFYLVNGVRERTYVVQENPDVLKYNVSENEKGISADDLLDRALQKVICEVGGVKNILSGSVSVC